MAIPQVSSLWYCETCQVQVWQRGRPNRLRCRCCRKFMTYVREVRHGDPR
jgi:hypothetical protein